MLQLFLFIDPGWDIHRQMTSDLLSLDRMTELPEYPCSHPSKSRSQNRMPEVNSCSIPLAMACKFLFAPYCNHSLYLHLSPFCLSSSYLSLFLSRMKETQRKIEASIIFLLYYLNIHWECGRGPLLRLKVQSFCLPATLLIGSSVNLTFHLLQSVSLDLWSQIIFVYLSLGFQTIVITFIS